MTGENNSSTGAIGMTSVAMPCARLPFLSATTTPGDSPPLKDTHHRDIFVQQGDGAMLEFSRSVSFCVDVADLLHLERALQCNGVVDTAPNIDHVVDFVELARNRLHDACVFEDLFTLLAETGHLRRVVR